jgi:hypothetical protein
MELRLLIDAPATLQSHWDQPRSYRGWMDYLAAQTTDVSGETLVAADETAIAHVAETAVDEPTLSALFHANQRARWLAHKTLNHWRHRIWSKRPQCGVDLIMNEPVAPADAIHLTDTRNRTIYCFHYRDLFTNLLTKITAAEEMLPTPRQPTNPWTNQPLTFAQIITVCQALLRHYATRGRCPPTLFAAYCAAEYNLRRFETENMSLLAQYAIAAYFKDLHEHNQETVADTVIELLRDAGQRYSAVAVRRWLRQRPLTPIHREWLALVRDYTLHMNLHIQPRRTWHTEVQIYADVVSLYRRTPIENPAGPRLRLLHGGVPSTANTAMSMAVLHLGAIGGLTPQQMDLSGASDEDLTTQATAALLLLLNQSFGHGPDSQP